MRKPKSDYVTKLNNYNEVEAQFLPFVELNDQSFVSISGLSSSIVNLTDSFKVGVATDKVGLSKTMTIGSAGGLIQDILVSQIPSNVAIGGSIKIGSGNVASDSDVEFCRVLDIFDSRKILRVL